MEMGNDGHSPNTVRRSRGGILSHWVVGRQSEEWIAASVDHNGDQHDVESAARTTRLVGIYHMLSNSNLSFLVGIYLSFGGLVSGTVDATEFATTHIDQ
jgi:hypothetical protein